MLKRFSVALALLFLFQPIALGGVEGTKAAYLGGTSSAIQNVKETVEGVFDTTKDDEIRFVYEVDKVEHSFAIPYASVVDLEYEQKPGRMALFSRKRMHYLTIGYTDAAGKDQVAVFELGKRIVRPTLTILERRTGKEIQVTK